MTVPPKDNPWPIGRLCLVSPMPPPYGGMAIQARKMGAMLRDSGLEVVTVATNPLAVHGGFFNSIPVVRSVINLVWFLWNLHRALLKTEAAYFLTGFFNFFFWVTAPALVLMRLHGVPVVLSARGGGARRFFQAHGRAAKPFMKLVPCITTPSGFLQEVFTDVLGRTPTIVPNIADLGQFSFRARETFAPRLLVTRNLEPIYDVGTVIRAAALVREEFPDTTLTVAGAGSQEAELKALTRELGMEDCVSFRGQLQHQDIAALYDEHDIFVNASRVDNLPGSILEAFASGLPVVSTRAGGIPYLVDDGRSGLLTDLGDSRALADNVLRVLREPGLGASLAEAGRSKSFEFSWQAIEPVLKELFATCRKS